MSDLVTNLPLDDNTEALLRKVAAARGVPVCEHVADLLDATAREWGAVVPEALADAGADE